MFLSSYRNDSEQKHTTSSRSAKKSYSGEGDSSIFIRKRSKKDSTSLMHKPYANCMSSVLV